MRNLFYFLSLSIERNKSRVLSILIPSVILFFLLFSALFISSSINYTTSELFKNLSKESLIYGRYYTTPKREFFLIVGSDEVGVSRGEMAVGDGVNRWLKSHYYDREFNFISSIDGEPITLKVVKILPKNFNANDTIIMTQADAKRILGDIEPERLSYKNFEIINFAGGFFKALYSVIFVGFVMLFYLRYSQLKGSENREKEILQSLGWSSGFFLCFKLLEAGVVIFGVVSLAFILSYIYTFYLNAPVLDGLFFGVSNLKSEIELIPFIDFWLICKIVFLYTTLFLGLVALAI